MSKELDASRPSEQWDEQSKTLRIESQTALPQGIESTHIRMPFGTMSIQGVEADSPSLLKRLTVSAADEEQARKRLNKVKGDLDIWVDDTETKLIIDGKEEEGLGTILPYNEGLLVGEEIPSGANGKFLASEHPFITFGNNINAKNTNNVFLDQYGNEIARKSVSTASQRMRLIRGEEIDIRDSEVSIDGRKVDLEGPEAEKLPFVEREIVLFVPQKDSSDYDVEVDAGKVNISNIQGVSEITTRVANIDVDGYQGHMVVQHVENENGGKSDVNLRNFKGDFSTSLYKGNVTAEGFNGKTIMYVAEEGDLTMKDATLRGEKNHLITQSGNIKASVDNTSLDIFARTLDGDIQVPSSKELSSSMEDDPSAPTIGSHKELAGQVGSIENSPHKVLFETGSGDVVVSKSEEK